MAKSKAIYAALYNSTTRDEFQGPAGPVLTGSYKSEKGLRNGIRGQKLTMIYRFDTMTGEVKKIKP